MVLGSTISFSMAETGPGMSSSRSTPGISSANSGWLQWSGSSRTYRSYSVSQSNFSLMRLLNSKISPYSVFLYPPLPFSDCILDFLRNRVFSPFVPFKDAPSFKT